MNRADAKRFKPQPLPQYETWQLWEVLDVKLGALWAHTAESSDRDAMRFACECWELFKELQLRGTQLELFPEE